MTATPEGSERAAAAVSDYSTSAVGLLSRHRKYKCMMPVYRMTPTYRPPSYFDLKKSKGCRP